MAVETFDQRDAVTFETAGDEETWPDQEKDNDNEISEHPQRTILETRDIWDIFHNWEQQSQNSQWPLNKEWQFAILAMF